jgi:hypothetical protein
VKSSEITEIRVWSKPLTESQLLTLSRQPLPLATKIDFNFNLLKRDSHKNKTFEQTKELKKGLKMVSKFDKKKLENSEKPEPELLPAPTMD